jgi:multisite-specific tRNA:(cytosine-C5)-methyltransferase
MDAPAKIAMSNDRFFKYYKDQPIVSEDEWDTFLEALRQPLPTTFRLAGNRQYVEIVLCFYPISFLSRMARELNDTIKSVYVPSLTSASYLGEAVSPPAQIPWYSTIWSVRLLV